MRVNVHVTVRAEGGWDVAFSIAGEQLATGRMVASPGPPGFAPQKAPDDLQAFANGAGVQQREQVAARLAKVRPQPGDVELMGRYLFASLIGTEAWTLMKERAQAGELIELALEWGDDCRELDRLHWELMRDDAGFLVGHPEVRVAISRIVAGATTPEPEPVVAPVRLLFVIGSHVADPRIRAGAEIMGLLRRIERVDRPLGEDRGTAVTVDARVSEWTSLSSLEAAAHRHRPDVVHFITHGDVVNGRGRLQLRKEGASRDPDDVDSVDAEAILRALRGSGTGLPRLAVITACQTGFGEADHTAPLAAELVTGGIPAVVGMTGRVSDMACRLFTHRFGTVLMEGGALVEAVSAGRLAALRSTGVAEDTMNWALPALFLAASVRSGFAPVDASGAAEITAYLNKFDLPDEPVFCGRREHLMWFDRLLDARDPVRVLAAYTTRPTAGVGKSRLLQEFARRALQEGHAVVFLREGSGVDVPKSVGELAIRLLRQIDETRGKLGLEVDPKSVLLRLLAGPDLKEEPADAGRALLAQFLGRCKADLDIPTLKAGLVPDLAHLARDARAARRPYLADEPRVVLLLENVQRWNVDLQPLFDMLRDLSDDQPVPVAMTCSMQEVTDDVSDVYTNALNSSKIEFVELAPFSGDGEQLAYQWLLLNPRPGVVEDVSDKVYAVRDLENPEWANGYQKFVRGLPGEMAQEKFYVVTGMMLDRENPLLIEGDDEHVLAAWKEQGLP